MHLSRHVKIIGTKYEEMIRNNRGRFALGTERLGNGKVRPDPDRANAV